MLMAKIKNVFILLKLLEITQRIKPKEPPKLSRPRSN